MTDLTLVIGNKNYSSWSLRAWVFMKYFNIAFTEKRIALLTDTSDDEIEPYFSNLKVPVLIERNFTVWDSLSILEYLSEKYLDNKGWPLNSQARAHARSVSCEMHSSFHFIRDELPMNCRKDFPDFVLSDGVKTDITRVKALWNLCRSQYGSQGPWLFGEFSIADAMFAPVVLRFKGYFVTLDDSELAYTQSLLALPCIQDWVKAGTQETEIIDIDEV